jgi:hypothetical protein
MRAAVRFFASDRVRDALYPLGIAALGFVVGTLLGAPLLVAFGGAW